MMRFAFKQRQTCIGILIATLCLGASFVTTTTIFAQTSEESTLSESASLASAPPLSRAPRGATGTLELSYDAAPLRAKPSSDLTAPVLVRVNDITSKRYRVEYMGLVSGVYDLAPYLEQADGRPAIFATPLTVEIFTQLPPNHGTDVFGLSAPSFGFRAHYRELLIAIAVLWIAVPTVLVVRRFARKQPLAAIQPIASTPTLEEQLFALAHEAKARVLSVDERGQLELMLLRTLRSHVADGRDALNTPATLSAQTEALRRDASVGPVILAVERWLHAATEGEAREALQALEALEHSMLSRGGAQPSLGGST